MTTDAQKLKAIREKAGLNQTDFGKAIGFSQSAIANVEAGKRELSKQMMYAINEAFNDITERNNVIDNNLITIPFYNISAAAGTGTVLADEPSKECMYFDKRFLNHILRCNDYSSLHLIYAKGDSMDSGWNQPDDIKDGDLLLVDTAQTTGNNQVFVIIVNNAELRVKKLFKRGDALYISSNNPAYKEEVYYPDNSDVEIRVVGKVVWNGKREEV